MQSVRGSSKQRNSVLSTDYLRGIPSTELPPSISCRGGYRLSNATPDSASRGPRDPARRPPWATEMALELVSSGVPVGRGPEGLKNACNGL